jgi:type VII secretion-associated serine protease mycosin
MAPMTLAGRARPARIIVAMVATLIVVFGSAAPVQADTIRDGEWWLRVLKVAQAQRITKGAGVTVAVVDSGVNAGHPDLRGAVLPGRDVVSGKSARWDVDGHGTAMAGIIAGRGHGGAGLLGIAPAAKILPVRPSNDTAFAAEGIRWAAAHGAKVINLSFAIAPSDELHAAIRAAAAADVVLVGAAGNSGNRDNSMEYPAAYPEVLGVGAVDRKGKVLPFSQHGRQVDIVAPGTDMMTAGLDDTYRTGWGTSNAAAIVSGAAALIRAKHPKLSAAQVVRLLTSTATDRGKRGRDDYYGSGVLNLVGALTATLPLASHSAPAVPDTPAAAPAAASTGHTGGDAPPMLIVAAGVIVLVVATLVGIVVVRRGIAR